MDKATTLLTIAMSTWIAFIVIYFGRIFKNVHFHIYHDLKINRFNIILMHEHKYFYKRTITSLECFGSALIVTKQIFDRHTTFSITTTYLIHKYFLHTNRHKCKQDCPINNRSNLAICGKPSVRATVFPLNMRPQIRNVTLLVGCERCSCIATKTLNSNTTSNPLADPV